MCNTRDNAGTKDKEMIAPRLPVTQFFMLPKPKKYGGDDAPTFVVMTKDGLKLEMKFEFLYAISKPKKSEIIFSDNNAIHSHIERFIHVELEMLQKKIAQLAVSEINDNTMLLFQADLKRSLTSNLKDNGISMEMGKYRILDTALDYRL